MRHLYLAATGQNRGKTTVSLGVLDGFRRRGLSTGFIKPVGQRTIDADGVPADEDAVLIAGALPLLKPGGVLFASTNSANWPPEEFLAAIESAVCKGGRQIIRRHYVPQPPDFPISRAQPAQLKTVWLKIA